MCTQACVDLEVIMVVWLSIAFPHLYVGATWIGLRALPKDPKVAAQRGQDSNPQLSDQ